MELLFIIGAFLDALFDIDTGITMLFCSLVSKNVHLSTSVRLEVFIKIIRSSDNPLEIIINSICRYDYIDYLKIYADKLTPGTISSNFIISTLTYESIRCFEYLLESKIIGNFDIIKSGLVDLKMSKNKTTNTYLHCIDFMYYCAAADKDRIVKVILSRYGTSVLENRMYTVCYETGSVKVLHLLMRREYMLHMLTEKYRLLNLSITPTVNNVTLNLLLEPNSKAHDITKIYLRARYNAELKAIDLDTVYM